MKTNSKMNSMRKVFAHGDSMDSKSAMRIAGLEGATGRKTINRLLERGELMRVPDTWPPIYVATQKFSAIGVVPNIGTVEHAVATAPRSIFDVARL